MTILARSRLSEDTGSTSQKRSSLREEATYPRPKKVLRSSEEEPEVSQTDLEKTGPHSLQHGPSQSLESRQENALPEISKEVGAEQRQIIDLIADKHGPKILALPTEERAWLLKVHKNMGHPNPKKLKTFCQQMERRPEMIEAIDDRPEVFDMHRISRSRTCQTELDTH